MGRLILFGAFLIGLLAVGHADSSITSRRMLDKTATAESSATSISTDSGKSASSSIAKSEGGTVTASVVADTKVFQETEVEIKEMWDRFQETISEDSTCEEITGVADTVVNERLEAVAEVYSSVFGTVSINGTGTGCVSGESEAEAISSAYLQVIIDLIGEIKFEGEDEAEAFANAYAELVTGATARAWAQALIDGCVSGEDEEASLLAEQKSFARATAAPTIIAFAWAEVGADCGMEAFSKSDLDVDVGVEEETVNETESTTEIEGDGTVTAAGDSKAEVSQVTDPKGLVDIRISEADSCSDVYAFCCFTSPSEVCRCTSSSNEERFRCKAEASEGTDKILWVDAETKEECYCSK